MPKKLANILGSRHCTRSHSPVPQHQMICMNLFLKYIHTWFLEEHGLHNILTNYYYKEMYKTQTVLGGESQKLPKIKV